MSGNGLAGDLFPVVAVAMALLVLEGWIRALVKIRRARRLAERELAA